MELNEPLVSVIITTYNRPNYLEITINSVLNQTYKNLEILVFDDNTPGDVNHAICAKFPNIYYQKLLKTGSPVNGRNKGIEICKGDFIAFLDDDDLWVENKIEKQMEILKNNLDFGLVHSPCVIIDSNGKVQPEIIGESFEWRNKHGDISMQMLGNFTLMMPTPLIRKEILNKVGCFNEKMNAAGEDVEFWTRCSFITKFYYINKPLAFYRVHENNISKNNEAYINLALFLKDVLLRQKKHNRINSKQYKLLLKNCIKMQKRYRKENFYKTIINLFKLDIFWFLKK